MRLAKPRSKTRSTNAKTKLKVPCPSVFVVVLSCALTRTRREQQELQRLRQVRGEKRTSPTRQFHKFTCSIPSYFVCSYAAHTAFFCPGENAVCCPTKAHTTGDEHPTEIRCRMSEGDLMLDVQKKPHTGHLQDVSSVARLGPRRTLFQPHSHRLGAVRAAVTVSSIQSPSSGTAQRSHARLLTKTKPVAAGVRLVGQRAGFLAGRDQKHLQATQAKNEQVTRQHQNN